MCLFLFNEPGISYTEFSLLKPCSQCPAEQRVGMQLRQTQRRCQALRGQLIVPCCSPGSSCVPGEHMPAQTEALHRCFLWEKNTNSHQLNGFHCTYLAFCLTGLLRGLEQTTLTLLLLIIPLLCLYSLSNLSHFYKDDPVYDYMLYISSLVNCYYY